MQLVTGLSGSIQVQGGGSSGWHNSGSVTIGPGTVGNNVIQPSYVIIYIDNQTIGKNVWFDNMRVEHYTSKLLEEDHYYPFGVTMKIEQAAQFNLPRNDIKFQGQRHDNDFGINIYSFKYREHDPTIGRFWQVDPLSEKYVHNSTYAFSENKVVAHVELEGLESAHIQEAMNSGWRELKANFQNIANNVDKFTFGDKESTEVKVGNITYKSETINSKSTNLGERFNYIMQYNTNEGLDVPYFKKSTETKSSVVISKEAEIKGIGKVSASASLNSSNESTLKVEGSFKTKTGLEVGASGSGSSNGAVEVEASISAKIGGFAVKGSATGTKEIQKTPGIEIGLGIEKEVGNLKYSKSVFIKAGE